MNITTSRLIAVIKLALAFSILSAGAALASDGRIVYRLADQHQHQSSPPVPGVHIVDHHAASAFPVQRVADNPWSARSGWRFDRPTDRDSDQRRAGDRTWRDKESSDRRRSSRYRPRNDDRFEDWNRRYENKREYGRRYDDLQAPYELGYGDEGQFNPYGGGYHDPIYDMPLIEPMGHPYAGYGAYPYRAYPYGYGRYPYPYPYRNTGGFLPW